MRGALLSPIPRVGGGRIIPAYAGSTSTPPSPPCRPRDHPRVCGEHRRLKKLLATLAGSSPRMRGAPSGATSCTSLLRIIPAYAGSTTSDGATVGPTEDHPRVCGEHARHRRHRRQCLGSSPRMRGAPVAKRVHAALGGIIPAYAGSTPSTLYSHAWRGGIIPAYAGSTSWTRWRSCRAADHPRVCGEHNGIFCTAFYISGSSPRMRGAQCANLTSPFMAGIIPAYAGSTIRRLAGSASARDHPRVCGEHRPKDVRRLCTAGSSPRMRGARALYKLVNYPQGIIPAYAGSTPSSRPECLSPRDHPRVCGEHLLLVLFR